MPESIPAVVVKKLEDDGAEVMVFGKVSTVSIIIYGSSWPCLAIMHSNFLKNLYIGWLFVQVAIKYCNLNVEDYIPKVIFGRILLFSCKNIFGRELLCVLDLYSDMEPNS